MAEPATNRAIEAVWRIESARLIAGLTRIVRDVGLAEDLAQDALVAALERWPRTGVPDNPGAWLMAAAKFRAIDAMRRDSTFERKREQLGRELAPGAETPDLAARMDDDVGDDLLGLVLMTCHPVLSTDARVALTLRLFGGLTTEEIARAFLVPEATVQQRVVRAKRTLAEARVPFEIPRGDELSARLPAVLEVIYLVFNEGYSATAGDDWVRPALCEDAMRMGRVLAGLAPREAEVHGLVALMELQASRLGARIGPDGSHVLLPDQDRSRWNRLLSSCRADSGIGLSVSHGPPGARYIRKKVTEATVKTTGTNQIRRRRSKLAITGESGVGRRELGVRDRGRTSRE